jgi:hypothetical protein
VSFTRAQALYMRGPETIDCHAGLSSVNRPNTHRRTVICDIMRENVMQRCNTIYCFVSFFSLFNFLSFLNLSLTFDFFLLDFINVI